MFSKASLIESGICSKEQLVQERQRDLLQEYMRDREKPLQEATSANAQKTFGTRTNRTLRNLQELRKVSRMAKRPKY